MRKLTKILLIGVVSFGILVLTSGVLLAASVVRSGMVMVKVDEPGSRIVFPVPAFLVYAGMKVLPLVEEDIWADARAELGEWGPVAAEALRAVEDAPDAVLVEVQNAREHVRITKEGRSLEIYVKGQDETVEISVPAGLLGHIAREIS